MAQKMLNHFSGGLVKLNSYRIAGKFDGDFNLAVWRIGRTSPNLNLCQILANNKHHISVMRTQVLNSTSQR